ncbi:unnamed protein product, partial [Brassica rapa]
VTALALASDLDPFLLDVVGFTPVISTRQFFTRLPVPVWFRWSPFRVRRCRAGRWLTVEDWLQGTCPILAKTLTRGEVAMGPPSSSLGLFCFDSVLY